MNSLANKFSDTTYAQLEPVGKGGPMLALFGNNMGVESSTARAPFIQWLTESQNLYLFGRTDGYIGDVRPTLNRTNGILNTFTATATRTNASITLKSISANEDGKWYLTKPFTVPPQGEGAEPIPLPLMQFDPKTGKLIPIPDELVDIVPTKSRVCADTETCIAWAQKNFDILADECRLYDLIRKMIHWKQQIGWVMGLYQWDAVTENSVIQLYEAQQWLPDDLVEEVADMNFLRLDVPTDANLAKRMHPELSAYIDANSSRTVTLQGGNTAMAAKYTTTTYARPMIVLCYCWLRNQEVPMTLEEGINSGTLELQEGAAPPEDSEATSEDGLGDSGVGEDAGEPLPARIIHSPTGDDVTSSFDLDSGEPNHNPITGKLHKNHPHKIVIRQWIQFNDQVIPGSDMICPHWDINVFADRNIPIIGVPWGRPETERIASPQLTLNNVHAATVDHASFFRSSTGFIYRSLLEKVSPPFKNGFMVPGTVYTVEGGDDPMDDINKKYLNVNPPPMPPAIPELKADISREIDIVAGNPGVLTGVPPSSDTSGVAIDHLQSMALASQGFKSMFTENAIWRIAKLKSHAEIHWMTMKKIEKINRSIPMPIVKAAILPFLRSILIGVDVAIPTGAGQVKDRHDAQIRNDFAAVGGDGQPLIDAETARDELDYDSEEIDRRLKHQREEIAEEQAQAAKAAAPPEQGPPPPRESMNLAIKLETLTPEAQAQALAKMGINITPGAAATLPPEPKPMPGMNGKTNGNPRKAEMAGAASE